MEIAFVDESGNLALAAEGSRFVVAALVCQQSRAIELHVRRARRALRRRLVASELKAAQSDPATIRRLLMAIAEETCEIYGVVVDKSDLPAGESEWWYQQAIAVAVASAVERHPKLHILLDKRYTNPHQRQELEERVRLAIAHVPNQVVLIEQGDSMLHPGLQAVDFVAWALRRQAEGAGEWAAIIEKRIVSVKIIRGNKTAARPGRR